MYYFWCGRKPIFPLDIDSVIEGCCEEIRIASSNVRSISMNQHKSKLGIYNAIGKMNDRLVYEKSNLNDVNYIYTWLNLNGDLKWHVGSNFTSKSHEIESRQYINPADQYCVSDMTEFKIYTKYPSHVLDDSQGWNFDPSLRVECFDSNKSQKCCPTIEVSSELSATFYPQAMGSYVMSDEYQVSGRRVYKQSNGKYFIYLHDWGPNRGNFLTKRIIKS